MGDSRFPQAIEKKLRREGKLVKTIADCGASSVTATTFHRPCGLLDGAQLLPRDGV